MERSDVETLATYNAEVARGIVHTELWNLKMERLQQQFNLELYGTEKPVPGAIYTRSHSKPTEGTK